jgi:hypothetical protein
MSRRDGRASTTPLNAGHEQSASADSKTRTDPTAKDNLSPETALDVLEDRTLVVKGDSPISEPGGIVTAANGVRYIGLGESGDAVVWIRPDGLSAVVGWTRTERKISEFDTHTAVSAEDLSARIKRELARYR